MNETENQRSDKLDEDLEELRLTVKEVAKHINESPGVIRNWMRELKTHIPTIQGENGYHYFDRPALERLLLIRKLSRDQNYSIKQIEYHFASGGKDIKPEPTPEASEVILKDLKDIKEQLDLQREFNEVLVQQLKKQQMHMENQQKYITDSLNKRDEQLMLAFRESQQARQETAAASQETPDTKQKKGFFSRFFSIDT
ncbi:helix-turn-helix domain-containing protein [Bacillus sp. UMB0893]|uniref:helix-turn-helix domain-containing protein n=1 Tax=Bacillus sp. UMB0893 TaxID=2066053 RepID=UPI0008AA1573|nr:helix-turn-helix domain-containing protein [Bacillus sp. UMB0893]